MDHVLLTLPGIYHAAGIEPEYRALRLDRLQLEAPRSRISLLPEQAGYDGVIPEFFPLPILPLPGPTNDAPAPVCDLSRDLLDHLLCPVIENTRDHYATYADICSRLQLATVANKSPATVDEILAQLPRALPVFTAEPLQLPSSWCFGDWWNGVLEHWLFEYQPMYEVLGSLSHRSDSQPVYRSSISISMVQLRTRRFPRDVPLRSMLLLLNAPTLPVCTTRGMPD
jgi:hypothetical protein